MRNAILVAGHAILRDISQVEQDAGWFLLDFQRGEPPCYIGHIRRAVELCAADPDSLLIFSGGMTRVDAGPRSEGLSYWLVAEHFGWFGFPQVSARAFVEDFARDSFENLLFGLCRFRELAGRLPRHVTLVSWEFKRERFEDLHRGAIGWPRERFTYIGANDPPHLAQALDAERGARAKYQADPYSKGTEFAAKKTARNPFRRQNGYSISCPELFPEGAAWL